MKKIKFDDIFQLDVDIEKEDLHIAFCLLFIYTQVMHFFLYKNIIETIIYDETRRKKEDEQIVNLRQLWLKYRVKNWKNNHLYSGKINFNFFLTSSILY